MPGVEAVARNQGVRANSPEADAVGPLISAGRRAMQEFAREINVYGQSRIDEAVTALAWSIYKPENARSLAEIAVDVTGIGEVESKVLKNQRKTFGTLRDLLRVKSTGRHRGKPGKGPRQIRQAGGCRGRHHAFDQSVGHPRQQGHDGAEGRQCHHHRPAADGLGGDQARRRRHAPRIGEDRAAGRPGADPPEPGHAGDDDRPDGAGRSGGRHRQPGQRSPGLQVRQAGDRRRTRQRAGHRRCDRRPRRRRAQDHAVEDLRPRDVVLVRERHRHSRSDLRPGDRRPGEGGRLPRDCRRAQAHRRAAVAGRQAQPRGDRAGAGGADRGVRAWARRQGLQVRDGGGDRHRQRIIRCRARSCRWC